MFTYLGLRNFRAFETLEVELAPITIFVGPNNSGKSSIISGLRILAQTALSEDFRIPLLLNGPMGNFGTHRDLVFQNKRGRNIGITLGATLPQRGPSKDAHSKDARIELTFAYRAQRRQVVLSASTLSDDAGRKLLTSTYLQDSEDHLVSVVSQSGESAGTPVLQTRSNLIHFLVPAWQLTSQGFHRERPTEPNPELRRAIGLGQEAFQSFFNGLQRVEYLGPFRAVPERTNLFSGERPARLGMDGAKAAHILASDYLRRGRLKKRLSNRVVQWFKSAGIATDLDIRVLGDRHFEMLIQHPVTKEYENLADVGYGVSQVLPVLAGGYNIPAESTFIVEEPEIHLHPRAQADLADFFANLYEARIQCILETHSEHLIVRLQKHVAAGRIPQRDVVVYYVHATSGAKTAAKLTLDQNGQFVEKWPRGFFEDRLQEVMALAQASSEG